MCGIVGGIAKKNSGRLRDNSEIINMMQYQAHRGPDDQGIMGYLLDDGYGIEIEGDKQKSYELDGMIGFNRLSVQDLSANGHQPMCTDDKRVIICLNGEIYNTEIYKRELEQKGYLFKSTTDTEIILYLYLEYGMEDMLRKLNGMFAIVILDLRIKKAFIARDRLGIKPLYFMNEENAFWFASEMKSFLAVKTFNKELDDTNLSEHFMVFKPQHSTLFKHVNMIESGTYTVIELESYHITEKRYFDINSFVRTNNGKESDLEELFFKHMKDCVERQKISDAKLGCQLSGGIDSSLVTYFAAGMKNGSLKDTISIIFDGEEEVFSEEQYADRVCELLNIQGHKEIINREYVINNIERAVWHADSIIGRPNSIGLNLLTEKARKYVTVLLSGEGADELFGGYAMFPMGELYMRKYPQASDEEKAEFAVSCQQKTDWIKAKRLYPELETDCIWKRRITDFQNLTGSFFDRQIKYALKSYLPELLLCQDKMSMANSIENRVPFLDNDMLEFAFNIPEEYLLYVNPEITEFKDISADTTGKLLLKKVSGKIFGKEFSYRRKMGFGLPYYRYFKDDSFKEYFYDCILSGIRKRGILNAKEVEDSYLRLGTTSWGDSELCWKSINFEIWCQLFLDERKYLTKIIK